MSITLIETENHLAKQWKSYGLMLMSSLLVVGSAWGTGLAFNQYYPLSSVSVDVFELMGYVLWGTGMAKPRISHLVNCAKSKALNRYLQLFCAEVGIFAFVFARTLA